MTSSPHGTWTYCTAPLAVKQSVCHFVQTGRLVLNQVAEAMDSTSVAGVCVRAVRLVLFRTPTMLCFYNSIVAQSEYNQYSRGFC